MTVTLTPRAEARLQALTEQQKQSPETIIETALDTLSEREGISLPTPPSADEDEQTRMRQAMNDMLAQAQTLKPEPRVDDRDRAPEEVAFGEIVVEKFRRQGFNL